MKNKSGIIFAISLIVLVAGCAVFANTQNYTIRNGFLCAVYGLWGLTAYFIIKETFE